MEVNTNKLVKQAYNGASKAIDKVADKAHDGADMVAEKAGEFESNLSSRYEALRDSASEGYDVAIHTVKKYPVYTVLGSAALGIAAGILIGRSSSSKH